MTGLAKAMGRAEEDGFEDLVARLAVAEEALAEEVRRSRALNRIAEAIGAGHDAEPWSRPWSTAASN
jgi:hypothetical protein